MSERPGGVAVLAILIMILGILGIIGGIFLAIYAITPQATLVIWIYQAPTALLIPAIIIIVGSVLYLIAGIGLWMVKNWGRILTIIISILSIIGSVIAIVGGLLVSLLYLIPGVLGFVIGLIIVVYLSQEDVKSYFS